MEEIGDFLNVTLDRSGIDNWLSIHSIKGRKPLSKTRSRIYKDIEIPITTCNDALLELTRDFDNLE